MMISKQQDKHPEAAVVFLWLSRRPPCYPPNHPQVEQGCVYTTKFAKEPFIDFVWGLEKRLVTLFCCSVHEHEFERGLKYPKVGT